MMKNYIRKMIQKTVFSSAMIMGLLTVGIGSANAAEDHPLLKDSDGNPIKDGGCYYLEPYEFHGKKILFDIKYDPTWNSTGHSVKLGDNSGHRIGIQAMNDNWDTIRLVTWEKFWIGEEGRMHTQKLGKNLKIGDEIKLSLSSKKLEDQWIVKEISSEGNYFSLQNAEDKAAGKQTFLFYSNLGEWLKIGQPTIESKKMWRLVKTRG